MLRGTWQESVGNRRVWDSVAAGPAQAKLSFARMNRVRWPISPGCGLGKGTTIGRIVLKLKAVRLDGQPITFPVALVRGLAAAFSVVVFFLGFLWIAWDKEKQSWHDKIADTALVRLPRTQSLVCF